MPDYECFPLWMKTENSIFVNIDPGLLPISNMLRTQLTYFREQYDQTLNYDYPPDSGFASEVEALKFEQLGLTIWQQLLTEIGSIYEIIYFSVLENDLYTDMQYYKDVIAQKQKDQ